MTNPFQLLLLSLEANTVIQRRLVLFAWGGASARAEASLMVREKVEAAIEAGGSLASGKSVDAVVARYREHVAANIERLAA